MENKAFNLILENLDKELNSQKFVRGEILEKDNIKSIYFEGEYIIYKLEFNKNSKNISLFSSNKLDENELSEDMDWKSVSIWALDEENDDIHYIEDISRDFLQTMSISKSKDISKKIKKKNRSDETTPNPLFLMNRLVNVFPELKEEIRFEKENYECFRGVTFTKEKVLPKVKKLLNSNDISNKKRFCKIISEMYISGDLDVRGIITFVIMNSIEDEKIKSDLNEMLSEEIKTAWTYSEKLKGKNIKPEKKKVKKSFMSKVLEAKQ